MNCFFTFMETLLKFESVHNIFIYLKTVSFFVQHIFLHKSLFINLCEEDNRIFIQ